MKTLIIITTLCCLFCKSFSQDYKYVYYLDTDLTSVSKSQASIIGKGIKVNGSFRLDCFSAKNNQLYVVMHFSDSSLSELHGLFSSYHLNGKLEKQGNYVNGFEDGVWQHWDELGRKSDSSVYKEGARILHLEKKYFRNYVLLQWKRDSVNFKADLNKLHKDLRTYTIDEANAAISRITISDSLNATLYAVTYKQDGDLESEAFFKGNRGEFKRYFDNEIKIDSVFTRELIEAEFPGGDIGWRKYLENNLNAEVPINNNARSGTYKVIVKFTVETDGSITDIKTETSYGYGMEQEVIKIISKGPKWNPAVLYGIKVRAIRRQPVVFVISNS